MARIPFSTTEEDMVNRVRSKLQGASDYNGKVASYFDLLIVRLCKFLCHRNDMGVVKGSFAYLKYIDDRGALPHESELQLDLLDFLRSCCQNVLIEVSHVSSGRTDIYISFDRFRFVIEVKRATAMKWSNFRMRPHLRQAAGYSSSDIRLGVLATLDLSVRNPGEPHVSECFDVIKIRPSKRDVRTVLVLRIPGNRRTPSSLS